MRVAPAAAVAAAGVSSRSHSQLEGKEQGGRTLRQRAPTRLGPRPPSPPSLNHPRPPPPPQPRLEPIQHTHLLLFLLPASTPAPVHVPARDLLPVEPAEEVHRLREDDAPLRDGAERCTPSPSSQPRRRRRRHRRRARARARAREPHVAPRRRVRPGQQRREVGEREGQDRLRGEDEPHGGRDGLERRRARERKAARGARAARGRREGRVLWR